MTRRRVEPATEAAPVEPATEPGTEAEEVVRGRAWRATPPSGSCITAAIGTRDGI